VSNVGIISRGYGDFITKLRLLGANFVIDGE
jgi:UDP-N-acetylglucosamine 1-carboxyvinyltransferase